MDNSPLIHLNYDVSRYLYEEYYPQEKNKIDKKMLNDQFKYFMNAYPEFYDMGSYPWFIPKDCVAKRKEWNDFYLNKNLDRFSYKLMLQFLKKHYTIRKKDNKIIYNIN